MRLQVKSRAEALRHFEIGTVLKTTICPSFSFENYYLSIFQFWKLLSIYLSVLKTTIYLSISFENYYLSIYQF